MDSLFILIPIAVVFVALGISAFVWAVKNHQYDDLDAAARSILFDDDVEVKIDDDLRGESQRESGDPIEHKAPDE